MRAPQEEKEQFISIFQASLALIYSKEMENGISAKVKLHLEST